MTKVLHIIAGLAEHDGGPSYSVPRLNSALRQDGGDSEILSTTSNKNKKSDIHVGDPSITYYETDRSLVSMIRTSKTLYDNLKDLENDDAICHVHGLWLMPNYYPAKIKRQRRKRIIVHSPRGMLSPAALAISPWKKRFAWYLWQKEGLELADCIHVTARSEYDEVRALGLKAPIAIIPNGIDISYISGEADKVTRTQQTLLSLGRIHPKKNLKNLILAWSHLEARYSNWRLRIVGPAEVGYDLELKKLSNSLGLQKLSVEVPVYGQQKNHVLRDADLFVLPTLNENFGMVVAEALAAGVPVISTKGAPWRGLVDENCGWWIDHGVEPLMKALDEAMNTNSLILAEMGLRGRAWMERDYNWQKVARNMRSVYEWLKYGGEAPSCVVLD